MTGVPRLWPLLILMWAAATPASERGPLLVDVYVTQDLLAAHDNRAVMELADGRIAVSNGGGLLVFDGARWRYFKHPQDLGGLSMLAPDDDGRLYAGFSGDLGWYAANGAGAYTWHSLIERVAAADRSFGGMGKVVIDRRRSGVWFVGNTRLFFHDLRDGSVRTIGRDGLYTAGFAIDGEIWLHNSEQLLLSTRSDDPTDLQPVAGREVFGPTMVRSAFRDRSGVLASLTDARIYRRADGQTEFLPFAQALWPRLRQLRLSAVTPLRDGRYVLAGDGGVWLLDGNGLLLDEFGEDDGITGNRSKIAIEARDGALWIAQERTIVRLDLASGSTRFDAASGLSGAGELVRWQGTLYVADDSRLLRLRPGDGVTRGRFERVFPQLSQTPCLARLDEARLLVGGVGIFAITGPPLGELAIAQHHDMRICNQMIASRFVAGRVYVGHTGGLLRIDADGPQRLILTPLPQVTVPVFSLVEEDAETLWYADRGGGLWRTGVEPTSAPPVAFATGHGLPAGSVRLYPGAARPWFATAGGLRRFDAATARFAAPDGMPASVTAARLFSVYEDHTGALWLRGQLAQDVLLADAGGWRAGDALRYLSHNRTINSFLREDDVLWVARSDDLLRIDLRAQQAPPPPLPPLLVGVDDLGTQSPLELDQLPALASEVRKLRFSFALASTFRHDFNRYRTRLSGVDAEFSPWSERAERDYTNLPDGAHAFDLEAMDAFGRVSQLPTRTLSIAAPWFRSRQAAVGYVGVALLALWAAARVGAQRRQRGLLVRQRELEATVAARTQELVGKNDQLAAQTQRLQEVDRLKTRFFINVGHEFRTPLTLVMGPVDDLLRDTRQPLGARVREQLALVQRNARRVFDLIVELLDVNRFEHGQLRLQRTVVDLSALLRRIAADSAPLLERYGQSVRLELDDAVAARLPLDAVQIERALGNLISNAAKYMGRGGCITLTLAPAANGWTIGVRDQGRGIAEHALPHVFDRFFQADGSDQASGYGIGLSLVSEIVEAHGGSIRVDSTLGVGTCFTIELPAGVEVAAPAPPETPVLSAVDQAVQPAFDLPAATTRRRVLVVDDHDDMRARVRGLLETRFAVIEAADGPSALRQAVQELPDLIVADVMMPGFDGVELTRRIRSDADTAAIGVLLLTAKVGAEHAVAGLRAGANDYLEKPFDASELLARIDAILGHAERLRLQLARAATPPSATDVPANDDKWRQRLDQLIAAHLHEPEFSVEGLADAMHADRSQLFRKCKERFSMSPSEYLRETRLQRAHALLQQARGSVTEVAYAVGFESLSGFTKTFKARFALSPSQVRGALPRVG